jgi:hypothetical protein
VAALAAGCGAWLARVGYSKVSKVLENGFAGALFSLLLCQSSFEPVSMGSKGPSFSEGDSGNE